MPLIEFQNLVHSFGTNRVFGGLSLAVERGETLTILGGSGSGKTLLLKTLLGLFRPDHGEVLFEGRPVSRLKEEELRAMRCRIGMLFQGSALFDSLPVRENVAYPLREHYHTLEEGRISAVVSSKLSLVGLSGSESLMPVELSGGMKKRVALARALATDPEVILYDEPTTGLDPANTQRINRLIVELKKKTKVTAVAVTHDLDSAYEISDRLALLHDGKIQFVGTVNEVRQSKDPHVRNFLEGEIAT